VEGNPKDSELYEGTIEEVKKEYGKRPESSVADGGYASSANIKHGQEAGIITVIYHYIFNHNKSLTSCQLLNLEKSAFLYINFEKKLFITKIKVKLHYQTTLVYSDINDPYSHNQNINTKVTSLAHVQRQKLQYFFTTLPPSTQIKIDLQT
jgi:hypothetical protein